MVSEFGEAWMGLEYKVWQLPIDQRAILINPQKGTAGSASGIDKMQSKDKAVWKYCMIMLIKAYQEHLPTTATCPCSAAGGGWWLSHCSVPLPPSPLHPDSGLTSVSHKKHL